MTRMSGKEGPTLQIIEVIAKVLASIILQIRKYLEPSYDNFSVYYY